MSLRRSFSWKLPTASHCHRSLCHPISSHHLNSSELIWCLLSLSRLFSADHNCSHLFSCHLSFSHLFSSHLGLSQLFSDFHSSSQLLSAFSCLLHFLTSSHISSADLRSCQLVSPHLSRSQRTLKPSHLFPRPQPAPKRDLDAKASNPYAFHREDFTQNTFTHSKLLHREAWTHRSFYTDLGKLFFTAKLSRRESLTRRSFCTQQTFPHSTLYTQHAFTHSNFSHKNLLHTEPCTHSKLLHPAKAFTHSKLFTDSKL